MSREFAIQPALDPADLSRYAALLDLDVPRFEEDLRERRHALERLMQNLEPPLHLTPTTRDAAVARDWHTRFRRAFEVALRVREAPERVTHHVRPERSAWNEGLRVRPAGVPRQVHQQPAARHSG